MSLLSTGGLALTLLLALVILLHKPYRPWPLVGHAPAVLQRQQNILRWMLRASQYFKGQPWRLEVPLVGKGWFVNDPTNLKFVLNAQSSFSKGQFFTHRTRDLFGHGILLATGESWKEQRKAGLTLVNAKNLDTFTHEVLPSHLHVLLDPLVAAASTHALVDMCELATDFSMAVFGHVALQTDWRTTRDCFSPPFIQASARIADRFRTPLYWVLERILPSGARLRADLRLVHSHIRDLVQVSKGSLIEQQIDGIVDDGRGMLIGTLLDTTMTEDRIADSCLNFITAGVDTTAQALSWTLYLLLRHPHYIEALQKEPGDTVLMDAIISESLRLHPPIPLEVLENVSGKTLLLPSGQHVLPGEQVMWSAWVMARLPAPWGEDADRFNPERWQNMTRRLTAYEWPVFHAGPRACLGQPMARAELAFTLRELLRRFDLEPAWEGEKEVGKGLTAPIQGGLPVRVRLRL